MRRRKPPAFLAVLGAALPLLSTPPAFAAAEPSPTELSVARRLFEEARAAEESGHWHEAAEKFRQATGIKDTPGMRFHLARCEEEQGQLVEALVEYDRARELLESGVRAPDVEKLLAGARERVRAKLALLTLQLPSDVKNASVELDSKPLNASVVGGPLPVNPGLHVLKVVAVGRAPFQRELALAAGQTLQLPIALPLVAAAPPVAAPAAAAAAVAGPPVAGAPSDEAASSTALAPRTIVLVAEATVFVAALGTAVLFTVSRSSAETRFQSANRDVLAAVGGSDPDGAACSGAGAPAACASLHDAAQDKTRAGELATVGFVAAGASAAAFGLTYWLWPTRDAAATVQASAAPGAFRLAISGHF